MQLDKSLFVTNTIHERAIQMPDGKKHPFHFREVPISEFRAYQFDEQSTDPEVRAGSVARFIAAALCDKAGAPGITYEQAKKLKPQAAIALMNAALEVNGFGGKKALGKG